MADLDRTKPYIVKLPDLLTPAECATLIARIEAMGPEIATINTPSGVRVRTDVRNNERVIFDDGELAGMLVKRAGPKIPQVILGMVLVGANERFRCYRYKPGMRFAPHADGAFLRTPFERSYYTFLVYLNDGFEGGQTIFLTNPAVTIAPVTGMGLLFQHPLIHAGETVTAGVKYVARTDIMYRRSDDAGN
jgi:prolyl 4-hydroxylase